MACGMSSRRTSSRVALTALPGAAMSTAGLAGSWASCLLPQAPISQRSLLVCSQMLFLGRSVQFLELLMNSLALRRAGGWHLNTAVPLPAPQLPAIGAQRVPPDAIRRFQGAVFSQLVGQQR